jgi:hypothetical protein
MRERKIYALGVITVLAIGRLSGSAQTPSPPNLPDANRLERQVQELQRAGKYSEAIPLAIELVDHREKARGPEHTDTATSPNNLLACETPQRARSA